MSINTNPTCEKGGAKAKKSPKGKANLVDESDPTWPKDMYGGHGTLEELKMYQSKPRQDFDDAFVGMDPAEVSPPPPPPPPQSFLTLNCF